MARTKVGRIGQYTIEVQQENERSLVAELVEAKCLLETMEDETDAQRDIVDLLGRQLDQVREDLQSMKATRKAPKASKGGR
jgi:sugar/nucleoside kinase (ribokinase family)